MSATRALLVVAAIAAGCSAGSTSQREALIVLEEGDVVDSNPQNRAGYEDEICSFQSRCLPITSCPLLDDLLDKSCLASDKYFRRLNALTCGWARGEARVCCPPGGMKALGPSGDPSDGGNGRPPGVQGDDSGSQPGSPTPGEACGRPMVQARDYEGIGSHPWVVRIGFQSKSSGQLRFPCSGSIISKRVVLTAAHCALAKSEAYTLTSVAVGEWDSETDPDCGDMFCATPVQTIPVNHVIVHPGYDRKIYRHDIAMLVLREDIKYTLTSLPVCLSESPTPAGGDGVRAEVSGWGRLAGQPTSRSQRQHLSVPLLHIDECSRRYSSSVPMTSSQLCAGAEPGRDACAGFGGTPLTMIIDGRYTQIGIVSFGSEKCGSPGVPSVYTDVYSYVNWIKANAPRS